MRISLTVQAGQCEGKRFEFEGHDNFVVGRSPRANLSLPDEGKHISRIHCMIELNPPHCRLIDVGSTNGTLVNGQKISTVDLKDGDRITVGKTVLLVSVTSTAAAGGKAVPRPQAAPAGLLPLREGPETIRVAFASACGMPDSTIYDPPVPATGPGGSGNGSAPGRCRVCAVPLPEAGANGSAEPVSRVGSLLCPGCRQRIRSHPQPLPGYRLVRELGRGGLGVVYQALRAGDAALVALKTIKPAVPGTPEDHAGFLAAARALGTLSHPNIVQFHEMGEHAGLFHFAMECVPGRDVGHLVKQQRGPLPTARAVSLVCGLLQALDHAHSRGFIHRDIKPGNLLVMQEAGRDVVKLADFGLSRIYQATPMSGLTLEGDLGGSPAFMAPEQFTELRSAFPAVDQYSAGALLYHLLTARYPYDFPERLEQKIMKILLEDPVPIRARRPDLPEPLTAIIDRALARKPQDRYASAREMSRALISLVR
jgi:serine/threonine-protein kinase